MNPRSPACKAGILPLYYQPADAVQSARILTVRAGKGRWQARYLSPQECSSAARRFVPLTWRRGSNGIGVGEKGRIRPAGRPARRPARPRRAESGVRGRWRGARARRQAAGPAGRRERPAASQTLGRVARAGGGQRFLNAAIVARAAPSECPAAKPPRMRAAGGRYSSGTLYQRRC